MTGAAHAVTYSDYRDVDGLAVPFVTTRSAAERPGGPSVAIEVWTTEQFKWNGAIDPKIFKPKTF